MKRAFALITLVILLSGGMLMAGEKLAFMSEITKIPNLYLYDPSANLFDTITAYDLNGLAGYQFTADGRKLATAVINPVAEDVIGLKLVTRNYPWEYEKIVMTFFIKNWAAVRGTYRLAIDSAGKYVACVDTFGTLLVDLQKEEMRYIFTHRLNPGQEVCESYYNWGGEFSPNGKYFCLQSYCIADRLRYDIYDMEKQEYRNLYELNNITGFSWLHNSEVIMLSANSCGESAGIYLADLTASSPLIDLEVCNLAQAECNRYFKDFYSEFLLPQVLGRNKFLIYARGVKQDGTLLKEVFIIDQENQVITEVIKGDFIDLKMSPSGRYLAGIMNPNLSAKKGQLFLYDFQTNQSTNLGIDDTTCSQIQWIDIK